MSGKRIIRVKLSKTTPGVETVTESKLTKVAIHTITQFYGDSKQLSLFSVLVYLLRIDLIAME